MSRSGSDSLLEHLSVVSAYSAQVCVGFLQVLGLLPHAKHMLLRSIEDSKLTTSVNLIPNGGMSILYVHCK